MSTCENPNVATTDTNTNESEENITQVCQLMLSNNVNNNVSSVVQHQNSFAPATPLLSSPSSPKPYFYSNTYEDENEEDEEETSKVIEESPNGRWSKLLSEISTQKLVDFDTSNLAIDSEGGLEIAWNEIVYNKSNTNTPTKRPNRFESATELRSIYEKLEPILKVLVKLDHSNLLRVYDHWFVENDQHAKVVVITEYSSGGSLRRLLEAALSKSSKSSVDVGSNGVYGRGRVKIETSRRWLNQAIYLLRSLHHDGISLFQGGFNAETIFIQSSGVIKLAPVLLGLNGLCTCESGLFKYNSNVVPNIKLNNEFRSKDLHALGRLAIQIFTAHLKSSYSPGGTQRTRIDFLLNSCSNNNTTNLDEYVATSLASIDDPMQREFVRCCFEATTNTDTAATVASISATELVWLHPFLNCTYSLKVLSVYSIFAFFQEKQRLDNNNNNTSNSSLTNLTLAGSSNSYPRRNSFSSVTSKLRRTAGSKLTQAYASSNADSNTGIYTLSEHIDDDDDNAGVQQKPSGGDENDEPQSIDNSQIPRAADAASASQPLPTAQSSASSAAITSVSYQQQQNATHNSGITVSPSSSYSNLMLNRFNKNRQFTRKVSLTFLTNVDDLKIPQDFFIILEDIRAGLYPRLFKDSEPSESVAAVKSIPSRSYIDFMIQHKQQLIMADRRRASLSSQHELIGGASDDLLAASRSLSNSTDQAAATTLSSGASTKQLGYGGGGGHHILGSSPRRFMFAKMHSIDTGDVELANRRRRVIEQQQTNQTLEETSDDNCILIDAIDDDATSGGLNNETGLDESMQLMQQQQQQAILSPPPSPNPVINQPSHLLSIKNNYPVEKRRILRKHCFIRKVPSPSTSPPSPPNSGEMVELTLLLELDDSMRRSISSQFSAEFIERLKSGMCGEDDDDYAEMDLESRHRRSILLASSAEYLEYVMCESPFEDKLRRVTEHLAHELVDHGLINPADVGLVAELLFSSILAEQKSDYVSGSGGVVGHTRLTVTTNNLGGGLSPPPPSLVNANFIRPSPECLNDDIFI